MPIFGVQVVDQQVVGIPMFGSIEIISLLVHGSVMAKIMRSPLYLEQILHDLVNISLNLMEIQQDLIKFLPDLTNYLKSSNGKGRGKGEAIVSFKQVCQTMFLNENPITRPTKIKFQPIRSSFNPLLVLYVFLLKFLQIEQVKLNPTA